MERLVYRLLKVSYICLRQLLVELDWYALSYTLDFYYIGYHRTLLGLHILLVAADVVTSTPLTTEAMTVADVYLVGIRDIVGCIDEPRFTWTAGGVRSVYVYLETSYGVVACSRVIVYVAWVAAGLFEHYCCSDGLVPVVLRNLSLTTTRAV